MHIANKFCAALVGVQVKKYHIAAFTDYCNVYVGVSPRICVWASCNLIH